LSFDFINKIRVAPVALGTTEHNRAQPNTQKSRKHLANSEAQGSTGIYVLEIKPRDLLVLTGSDGYLSIDNRL
jgi:hypothetical protein